MGFCVPTITEIPRRPSQQKRVNLNYLVSCFHIFKHVARYLKVSTQRESLYWENVLSPHVCLSTVVTGVG